MQVKTLKHYTMITYNQSAFEAYSELEISKELRLKIRNKKNEIIAVRYPNGGMNTEEHEQILIEACAANHIIL